MFDYTPIATGIISIIRDQVGSALYQVQGQSGMVPAIFQDRQKQYKNYPYITVDRLSTRNVEGWVKDISVNEDDNVEYTYVYQCLYLISAFGENADGILTHLKQSFSFDTVRQKLYEDSGNLAVFQRSEEVVRSPVLLETDYEPQASMEITINFESKRSDLDSTIIDSVEIEENFKETEVSSPITNTITAP